jgi:FAD/FMN-containing dehydrogenase
LSVKQQAGLAVQALHRDGPNDVEREGLANASGPAATEANVAWARVTFATVRPQFASGRWLDYLGDDQQEDAIRAAYGANFDRLRAVKQQYDPENVFHLNHKITP